MTFIEETELATRLVPKHSEICAGDWIPRHLFLAAQAAICVHFSDIPSFWPASRIGVNVGAVQRIYFQARCATREDLSVGSPRPAIVRRMVLNVPSLKLCAWE